MLDSLAVVTRVQWPGVPAAASGTAISADDATMARIDLRERPI
jgi:hypothetical protein